MDTLENLLSRSHKVLLDSKAGGTGNMLYLPLDKLLDKANGRADLESGNDGQGTAPLQNKEPDSVTVEARSRGDR
ncbi:MAG: hypothetical protein JOY91_07280 [Sinobacteraceae bacterium]|nr:hypothetical protein [Nevskiaceae bacterium]